MEWDKLEEVFDQEMWALIDRLIERGLDLDQATMIMEGFGHLTFDGYSFPTVYEEYQEAEDKEDYKKEMKELINIYQVEI